MYMPKVLNKRKDAISSGAVYIGRGSIWGNPFKIGPDGNRADVIMKHAQWFFTQEELVGSILDLQGRDLVCYCNPLPCHGDLLLWLANMGIAERRNVFSEFVK